MSSRVNMMVDFSFIQMDRFKKSWKLQGFKIIISFQHPPSLRNLLGHMIMFLRLIDIGPINTKLS